MYFEFLSNLGTWIMSSNNSRIFQSENLYKEKRLRRYLDDLHEEAKKNDYLSGKTLADNDDQESIFWQTPSQSASRNKRTINPQIRWKIIDTCHHFTV